MTAKQYIHHLRLLPHSEGGFYSQNYCSSEYIPSTALPGRFTGSRSFSTAIYYLLEQGDFSGFHKIKSDECWHFYAGNHLLIHVIETNGNYLIAKLGNQVEHNEVFQFVVPAGAWFATEPAVGSAFGLAGCTVAPGFDFADFEMADKKFLLEQYPQYQDIINRLCR